MLNSRAFMELQIKPFILSMFGRVDCSNSINHDQVQVLNYSK